MAIIDHGFWIGYTPLEFPEGVPKNAVFCRRESDGMDWYEYVNVEERFMETFHKGRKKRFAAETVKCVVEVNGRDETGQPVVRCAAVDETRLFPQDCRLIELTDVTRKQDEPSLIEEFANRRIDLKTGKVGERWAPKPDTTLKDTLEAIMTRLERLEGKSNG